MRRWMESAGLLILAAATLTATLWLRHQSSPPEPAIGEAVPRFKARTLAGAWVSDRTLSGDRYALVFLNPRCGLCGAAFPKLSPTLLEARGRMVLVLSGSERPGEWTSPPFDRAVVLDRRGAVGRAFGVRWYPTIVLVDSRGRVADRRSGLQDDSFYDRGLPLFLRDGKGAS